MLGETPKLHRGEIHQIKDLIKSFDFQNGNLVSTNYEEFDKLDKILLRNQILENHFGKYQLGLFIQNLAFKFLTKSHIDIQQRALLFSSDEWLDSCVENVISILESVPLEYKGVISLPACTTLFPFNLEVTSQISFETTPNSASSSSLGLLSATMMKAQGYNYWQTDLLPNTHYLSIKVKGFSDGNVTSTASNEFLSCLKQFVALALILELVTADKYSLGFEINQRLLQADRTVTPHWVMSTKLLNEIDTKHIEVPPELANFINTLNLNSNDLIVYAKDPSAKTLLGSVITKSPETEEEFNEALIEHFKKVTSFFDLAETHDKKRICSALEWFLEAKVTTNQSASLIYFCIGLEAVLGDESNSKELQLKEKLADRVAYMIGRTSSQREAMKADFRAIYSARSDLVHAKESRISKKKVELLGKAEVMLSFLISREINGLLQAKA